MNQSSHPRITTCVLLLLAMLLAVTGIAAQVESPAKSTTGPLPPPNVGPKIGTRLPTDGASHTIPGVPGYSWRHGCGPTAVGMVVGYWDGQGFENLIPGSAATQTADVNQAMASQGSGTRGVGVQKHYEDYSLPKDSSGPIQKDSSETYPRNCHADDCIADFMNTSWSTRGMKYGWSWGSMIPPGFLDYVALKYPSYARACTRYTMASTLTWPLLKNEIDNHRPMVFLVDSQGNGSTDHFVTIVGYNETSSGNQYGCLDTWSPAARIRWCLFRGMSSSYAWGVWGGWTFRIGSAPALTATGSPRVGSPVVLDLSSPEDASRCYVLGSSFGRVPGMVVDTRTIPLNLDPLLFSSWTVPSVFRNYTGTLDGQGKATTYIHIPALPAIAGTRFYTAFVTLLSSAPSGIRGISDAVELRILP